MPGSSVIADDQQIISDDGREVLLKQDGTWEFRSNDRFATTEDGRRVRLKADGSWMYLGNAPSTSEMQVRTQDLEISLQRVVIETHEKKVQKNVRVKSQTVFHLQLALSPHAASDITTRDQDLDLVAVTDNKGRQYPVLSMQPVTVTLKPDTKTSITIRVDGSPQWWKGVDYLKIALQPNIFNISSPITLISKVDDMGRKKVDGFD